MNQKYYSMRMHCTNCDHSQMMTIGRGIPAINIDCPKCGCPSMQKETPFEPPKPFIPEVERPPNPLWFRDPMANPLWYRDPMANPWQQGPIPITSQIPSDQYNNR